MRSGIVELVIDFGEKRESASAVTFLTNLLHHSHLIRFVIMLFYIRYKLRKIHEKRKLTVLSEEHSSGRGTVRATLSCIALICVRLCERASGNESAFRGRLQDRRPF
jgi:hypothetical protein